ncbi:MAG: PKD domain-containing protein [Opitutales bacterium]|nr:PKD domain-containing protein [Opitutales bacterium]
MKSHTRLRTLNKTLLACLAITPLAAAQEIIEVPGWTYHRYGEEIGLLGNRFIAYVPESYDPDRLYRVFLNSHGAGSNPESSVSSMLSTFNERGVDDIIAVFPHQTGAVGEWRFSHPDLPATQDILAHFQKIRRDFNVYEKIFVHGFSLGGQFTTSFGMFLADEIIAAAAGGFGNSITLPNGDHYWSGELVSDISGFNFGAQYFPYATLTPPETFRDIPWFLYVGLNEQQSRIDGTEIFDSALTDAGADVTALYVDGVGHDITAGIRDALIDFYVEKVRTDNLPPVADAVITHTAGLIVQFDATGSSDPDGHIARYEWVFGDGERALGDVASHPGTRAHTAVATHTFSMPGTYIVRLRATDNDNDMNTIFRAVSVEEEDLSVTTPPTTYAVHVDTPYATEYEFTQSDFTDAVDISGGRSLEKIRIHSLPIKGTLRLNGVPVEAGQEVSYTEIPFLAYRSPSNEGEDFFEYNAHDGASWSPFDTSRVNIMIGDAPESELFTEINPVSGSDYATGTLGVGTLYFTNEQSEISQVPPELDGAPIIRPSSIPDRTSTAEVALTFRVTQDATVYIAYDPRPHASSTPPDWLADYWTEETFEVPLRSWFDFRLYRREFSADSVVETGGNRAAGWSGNNSMYFIIGLPEGAARPTLAAANVEAEGGAARPFSRPFFEERFQPGGGAALTEVRIDRLPFHGRLLLGGAELSAGDVISAGELDTLAYEPGSGYAGFDNFIWNASDGEVFAEQAVKVNLTVTLPPPAPDAAPILGITRAADGGFNLAWHGRVDRRYTLRHGSDLGGPAEWEAVEVIDGVDGPMERAVLLDAEAPARQFWIIEVEPK